MLMSWLYRIALRRSRKVFFHNSDDRDQFVGAKLVRVEQTAVLPGSGIDLNRFKPGETIRSDGLPTFLFIGRLLRDKGAVEFAEAAKIVRAQFKARFQILGPTDDHPKAVSRDRMKAWEAEGLIELLGAAPDVRPFIRNDDCVVLPSYREGFPRVLLEASAMAKPVIASDVPGCSHAVDHRVTGLLCQARSAQSLAAAMIGFLNTPATDRIAMGSAGRAKAEREFSEDIVSDAYIRALDELALSAGDRLQGAPC
jgi:glycosyltransferase involved in cell wall biosynthesis